MPQLENLFELIRTVNEVYFITAPERVRAAYILVDDIVELALKSFLFQHTMTQREQCRADFQAAGFLDSRTRREALVHYFEGSITLQELATTLGRTEQVVRQRLAPFRHTPTQQANCLAFFDGEGLLPNLPEIQALEDFLRGDTDLTALAASLNSPADALSHRLRFFGNLQHWSVNEPNNRVDFYTVVNEVKALYAAGSAEADMLEAVLQRHEARNRLYHDHHHTAWSISDVKCLRALCDLFALLETLFSEFGLLLHEARHNTVRCQIGVLRLKLKAADGRSELVAPYNSALDELKKDHSFELHELSVEHSIVHTVSENFFRALRNEYRTLVGELQARVEELHRMRSNPRSRRKKHDRELLVKSQRLELFREELGEIDSLLGGP